MRIVNEILFFLKDLRVDDYIFFFAVIIFFSLIIALIYFSKMEDSTDPSSELEVITKKIEKEYKPQKLEFTNFEKEQEESAIISYKELLNNSKNYELKFEEETKIDGLTIKKVNSEDMFEEVEDFEINIKEI